METKLDDRRLEIVWQCCGFTNGFSVATDGTEGGLCLAWRMGLDVTLRSFSSRHIDVLVKENGEDVEWRFTSFYGSPVTTLRQDSWDLLRQLREAYVQPWLVCGDINEVLYTKKKSGG